MSLITKSGYINHGIIPKAQTKLNFFGNAYMAKENAVPSSKEDKT